MSETLFGGLTVRQRGPIGTCPADTPLVVAIHGGTYTSAYFDVPGWSLLDRAAANAIPIIALDRPAYAGSPAVPAAESTIEGQARYLTQALKDGWRRFGAGAAGIVLIGHSIGGAIAATIASEPEDLPLLGLAISGVGLQTPPAHAPLWQSLPDTPLVSMPDALKDQLMFGPAGSFSPAMPAASHAANTTAPKAELIDITTVWSEGVRETLGRITVPVHYRQAEFDNLWIVDQAQVDGFARALTQAPQVDAALARGAGHCIDFHRLGAAFQLQQLSFALQCASG